MVRRFFEALQEGDRDNVLSTLLPSAVYRDSEGNVFAGPDAIARSLSTLSPVFERIYTYEALHIAEAEDGRIMKVKTSGEKIRRIYVKKMDGSRRMRLDIAYNGTLFFGFQRQKDKRTVQGELEGILEHILGHEVSLAAAGRTDRGVHARQQVAHFDTTSTMSDEKLLTILGRMAPEDILPHALGEVPTVFHARYDALAKTYRYTLRHTKDPFAAHQSLYHPPVDEEALLAILSQCTGTHDFRGLAKTSRNIDPVKTIHAVEVVTEDAKTHIEITGRGFLRHMVRIIVGNTLRDLSRGSDLIGKGLAEPARNAAKFMVPSSGLMLKEVHYT